MCNKFCFNHEYLKKKIYHNPEFMLWCYPSKVNLNSTVDHISSVRNTISHRGRWALGINFSDFPVVAPLCIMLQQANNIQKQTKWKKKPPKQAQDPKIRFVFMHRKIDFFLLEINSNYTGWT